MFGLIGKGQVALDRIGKHEEECAERYRQLMVTIQDSHAQRIAAVDARHKENQEAITSVKNSIRWIFLQIWGGALSLIITLGGIVWYLLTVKVHIL